VDARVFQSRGSTHASTTTHNFYTQLNDRFGNFHRLGFVSVLYNTEHHPFSNHFREAVGNLQNYFKHTILYLILCACEMSQQFCSH
jgi:hypothetical protein